LTQQMASQPGFNATVNTPSFESSLLKLRNRFDFHLFEVLSFATQMLGGDH
jgi:hypothetical protein